MRLLPILTFLLYAPAFALGGGVPVDPNTPSGPPPAPPPTRPTAPPDCVKKLLEAIAEKEKAFFDTKKSYSDSLLEIRALSAIGLGCPGWELPVVATTYGGTGYNASMTETATGDKWTLNQDKALILDQKEIKPAFVPPAKK